MKGLSAKHFEDSNTCHLQLEETALIFFQASQPVMLREGKVLVESRKTGNLPGNS